MDEGFKFLQTSLDEVVSEFPNYTVFSLDLETTGLNPLDSRITLCQIGFGDKTFVIDATKVALEPLLPFLKSRKWLKIIQNAKFENKFFQHFYKIDINNIFDTKIAENMLSNDSASLAALSQKYAYITLDKSVRASFTDGRAFDFSEEQLKYAALDAQVLFPIYEAQLSQIKEFGLEEVANLEFELTKVVANMELVGVPIDQKKWLTIIRETEKRHEESRERLNELLFDIGGLDEQMGLFNRVGINLNSPKQVKEAFQKLGIQIDATNEREIAIIDHPAARELLRYRELQKILSSYGDTFLGHIHPFTNRIHADFQQLGTQTGRFSCKEPNLQQMPDEFRQCVSQEGFAVIAADYSQIELRILAELSGDPNFMSAFKSGEDLHKATAATMFGIQVSEVTKEQRFIAKTINFGLAYGMGSMKLMDILNAEAEKNKTKKYTVQQTKSLISRYRNAYRKVVEWLDNAGQTAYRTGQSETMFGRKRFFQRPKPGIDQDLFDQLVASIKRQGANAAIQGTNADITKLAMLDIHNELKINGFSADIVVQVHDEIVVLARKVEAEAVKEMVVNSMIRCGEQLLKNVPIKVEAYITDTWSKG